MNPDTAGQFYSGTSGLVLPFPKSKFPPGFQSAGRLEYYASLFNSIEINSSFYKMPMAATVSKWAAAVPGNFRFSFKLSKDITHVKGLLFNAADVNRFMEIISQAEHKKGCLIVQFPAGLKIDSVQQLEKLLTCIKAGDPQQTWNIAVEFRDSSWYKEDVYKMLEEFQAAVVLHDIAVSAPPVEMPTSTNIYLRFHGAGELYRGSYSNEVLEKYAALIKAWTVEGKTVYCYFNNTMGDAFNNLKSLNQFVQAEG